MGTVCSSSASLTGKIHEEPSSTIHQEQPAVSRTQPELGSLGLWGLLLAAGLCILFLVTSSC